MPYKIRFRDNRYQIVRKEDNKVVGNSVTRKKAVGSIVHRMEAESKK